MTDLEQLARIIYANEYEPGLNPNELPRTPPPRSHQQAQAIIDAGWQAPPEETSGYTTHGHPIKGQAQTGKRPPIARCGGPRLCKQCKTETN